MIRCSFPHTETGWIRRMQRAMPGLPSNLAGWLLWNETCYPVECAEVARQIEALAGTWDAAEGLFRGELSV